jgi:hypothetical protein
VGRSEEVTPVAGDRTGGPAGIDASAAHPARAYNAWLGGKDNYAAANPDIPTGWRCWMPGVVQLPAWRPGPGVDPARRLPMWCGVGRKP